MLGSSPQNPAHDPAEPRPRGTPLREASGHHELRYEAVFNSTFQMIGVLDISGRVLDANDTALQFAGAARDAVVGRPVWETPWFARDSVAQRRLREAVRRAAAGELVRYEERITGADDALAEIDLSIKPVRDESGAVVMLIPEGRDITESQRARAALRDSERRFRLSFEHSPIGKALVGLDGEWLAVNASLCEMFGYPEEDLLRLTWQDLTVAEDIDGDWALVQDTIAGNRSCYRYFKRYRHKSGRVVQAQLDVALLREENGQPLHFVSQIQDITARRQAEDALFEAKELAQITLASIADGVIRTDSRGIITYSNDAACRLTGQTREQLLGARSGHRLRCVAPGSEAEMPDPVDTLLRLGADIQGATFPCLRGADGVLRPISYTVAPLRARDGVVLGCVFVFQDVSEAHALNEQLAFQARHDALTGLLNRRAFREALEQCEADGRAHSLLYLDIDHFKRINDACGHAAGDQVLVDLARLLRRRLRSSDQAARLGGDELAVLLPVCEAYDAVSLAESLLADARGITVDIDGQRRPLGFSMGVVTFSTPDEDALQRADAACYAAKRAGRGQVRCFEDTDIGAGRRRDEPDGDGASASGPEKGT